MASVSSNLDSDQYQRPDDEEIKSRLCVVDSTSNSQRRSSSPSEDTCTQRYTIVPGFMKTAIRHLKLKRRIEVISTLGAGRNGTVVKAWDGANERDLAIKIQAFRMQEEMMLWKNLHHPNIIPLLDTFKIGKHTFAYLMPLLGPTLEQVVAKKEFRESCTCFGDLQKWFRQITNGLNYLHQQGLYHGDIKPDNILLTSENEAVLSDFTFLTKNTSSFKNKIGLAMIFRAPELWKTTVQAGGRRRRMLKLEKLDIWALGVTFLDSLDPSKLPTLMPEKRASTHRPRRKKRQWQGWDIEIRPYLEQVKNPGFLEPHLKLLFPNANLRVEAITALADLLRFILVETPEERPPVSEVLNHPFFAVDCSPAPNRPVVPHRPIKLQNKLTICDRLSHDEPHKTSDEREAIVPQKKIRSDCYSSLNLGGIFPNRMVCLPRPNLFLPMMYFSNHIVSTLFPRK